MSQVLVGLIGVIVGGLLGGLSSWLLDLSRDRRHRRDSAEREARELKRAARLLQEELYVDLRLLCEAVDQQQWWRHPHQSLRTARWGEYEPFFAGAEIPDHIWGALALAYEIIWDLNGAADERANRPAHPFTAESETGLRLAIAAIDEGRRALADLNDEPAIEMEPDAVAAMQNAAAAAARELLPDDGEQPLPFRDREGLRVVSDEHTVIGVALLRAPRWISYRCTLPLESKLTVVVPAIGGTRACAVGPLGERHADSEIAKKFVPDEIRLLDDYSDFLLLLRFPHDRALVSPWHDDPAPVG